MKIKNSALWKTVMIGLVLVNLVIPSSIFAEEMPAKTFKQEELEQLIAPIALYSDGILSQILMASTYPLEVVKAERWSRQNKDLKGEAMKTALDKQPWDQSVKSLVSFPDVLSMMNEKLEWTQQLGDAFLAQQKDVMDTVQKLRRKAMETGNLKSSKEQEIKKEGEIIIIQPANPQVIYIPTYNPMVVYGTWPYPAYPPYPVYVYPTSAVALTFTMGVVVGASWCGWGYHNDWHGGAIIVPPPPPPPPPPRHPNQGPPPPPPPAGSGTKPSPEGAKAEQWKHNPEHRQGVAYPDAATRDKYSSKNPSSFGNIKGYREQGMSGTGTANWNAGRQKGLKQDGAGSGQSMSPARSHGGMPTGSSGPAFHGSGDRKHR